MYVNGFYSHYVHIKEIFISYIKNKKLIHVELLSKLSHAVAHLCKNSDISLMKVTVRIYWLRLAAVEHQKFPNDDIICCFKCMLMPMQIVFVFL